MSLTMLAHQAMQPAACKTYVRSYPIGIGHTYSLKETDPLYLHTFVSGLLMPPLH